MAFETLTIGDIEVLALLDGDREREGSIADSFPQIPIDDLLAFRDRAPGVYGDAGGWRLRIRAWLVRHPGGVLLVDTGIGPQGAPGVEWFGTPGHLHAVLRETGTPLESIEIVVLTHVHDDHIGGTITFDDDGTPVPAFPNARYVVQRADRVWQRELADEDEEDRVIDSLLLQPLERAGLLELIEGDHMLVDGIELHHAPGHTPGHQVVRLRSGSARAIITADAFNHPIQVGHPEWPSGADEVPERAAMTRRDLFAELRSHPDTTIAPTHLPGAFGRIRSGADGLDVWEPC